MSAIQALMVALRNWVVIVIVALRSREKLQFFADRKATMVIILNRIDFNYVV